jgi:hypothetical protein
MIGVGVESEDTSFVVVLSPMALLVLPIRDNHAKASRIYKFTAESALCAKCEPYEQHSYA